MQSCTNAYDFKESQFSSTTVPLQVEAEVSLVLGDPDTGAIFSILAPPYSTITITLSYSTITPQTIDCYTTLSQKEAQLFRKLQCRKQIAVKIVLQFVVL